MQPMGIIAGGGWSGTGATNVPTDTRTAFIGTAAPEVAITINAPATTVLVIVLRTPGAIVQLITRS